MGSDVSTVSFLQYKRKEETGKNTHSFIVLHISTHIHTYIHAYSTHNRQHTHHLNAMRKETKTETDARTANKLIITIKIALTLMNPVSDTEVEIIATTFPLLFHFHTNFQCLQWL